MGNEEVDLVKKAKSEKKQPLLEKWDIPIEHISYEYVGECKNAKELERIVRILRSGEEGTYPHLTSFAEDRLRTIKPESPILRVAQPVVPRHLLEASERTELDREIDDWLREMRVKDRDLGDEGASGERAELPKPGVRSVGQLCKPSTTYPSSSGGGKRLSSCDYAGWDRYDADTELSRIDLADERERIEAKRIQELRRAELEKTRKETIIEKSLLTGTELSVLAGREREKGNEAYRAGDYEEALQLYTASVRLDCDVNAYNNRAMTYIKLKKYDKAIEDCDEVLNIDCANVKALLRRGLAYEHLKKNDRAIKDYEAALREDPENKVAIASLNKLREFDESDRVRLTIEEIYD